MKKELKRMLIVILLTFFIISCFQSTVFAADSIAEQAFSGVMDILGGIIGILLNFVLILLLLPAMAIVGLVSLVCTGNGAGFVTVEDIIFSGNSVSNAVGMLDVNIFKTTTSMAVTEALRQNVATWYFNLRNVAIVISLIVLLYVGIRMAISSIASEKAEYKKMLVNWATSFIVLFILHYLMIAIVSLNNELVTLIYNLKDNVSSSEVSGQGDYMGELLTNSFSFLEGQGFEGIASIITYVMCAGVTVAFFVLYVKRLLTVSFLIIIAPLITITYAIDKMGDGKSQALSTWMKEFVFNVLIQPFHCIIYIVFVNAAFAGANSNSLSGIVFATLSMLFIFQAENIVKKIFGFEQTSSMGTMAAAGGLAVAGLQNAMKLKPAAGKVKNTVSKVRNRNSNSTRNSNSGNSQAGNGSSSGTQSGSQTSNNSQTGNANSSNSSTGNGSQSTATSQSQSSTTSSSDGYNKDATRQGRARRIANAALSTGLKGMSKSMKLAPALSLGLIAAGATGSAGTGFGIGTAVNSFTGQHKFTRSLVDNKIDKLDLNRQRQKALHSLDNFKNNNPSLSDDEINDKLEELMDTEVNTIHDKVERKLAKEMQEYGSMFEKIGYEDGNDIALGDIMDLSDITKSLNPEHIEKAFYKLKGQTGYSKNTIEGLTTNILNDINTLGDNYKKSSEYKDLDKEVQKFANQLYKDKKMTDAIANTNSSKVDDRITNIINNC